MRLAMVVLVVPLALAGCSQYSETEDVKRLHDGEPDTVKQRYRTTAQVESATDYLAAVAAAEKHNTSLTRKEFVDLCRRGRDALAKGTELKPQDATAIRKRPSNVCRILSHYDKNTRYNWGIVVHLDGDGKVMDFQYDYSMGQEETAISAEHLMIFLRYVSSVDFRGMARKGQDIFREGNSLPDGWEKTLAKYRSRESKDAHYVFYDERYDGGAAWVHLRVDADGKVLRFNSIEEWIEPTKSIEFEPVEDSVQE